MSTGWVSPEGLARASSRRPKSTIAAWVVGVAVAGALSSSLLGDALTTESDFVNMPESRRAEVLIEERLRGPAKVPEVVVVRAAGRTVDDAAFRTYVQRMARDVAALGPDVVEGVQTFYDTNDASLVSRDRDATMIRVVMAGSLDDAEESIERVHDVTIERARAGFEVAQVGEATITQDFSHISETDIQKAEIFGLPIALAVLVLVFGAVVAALVPIILGFVGIGIAIGLTALLGLAFDFSFFVTNMITMMGLAVGIDYSLFVVSRYREERARGREKLDAIAVAGATASRAVFFSGLTVVLALLGMLLIPTTIFRSLATGAILVVLASMAASMTLLPAVLALLGDRVDKLRVPILHRRGEDRVEHAGGFWDRTTRRVMRRPVASIVVTAGLLLVAATPLLDIETGFSGVSTLPEDTQSKKGFTLLSAEFAGGFTDPALIVVDGEVGARGVERAVARLRAALERDGRFGPSSLEVNDARDLALVSAPIAADPSSGAAEEAVRDLRARLIPQAFGRAQVEVLVGGFTAMSADFFDLTDRYTPIVFAFVLGLSFLLLTVVFRSLVVPAKAIVMNLLSVGAAYGLVVLVNQKGYGAGVLGFQQVEKIEAWLPLFLFSVLFGLSMDYHVFLLSRIKERWDQTGDNTEAVSFGVRSTAGIITGAALIMVAVFAGFAGGDLVMMQQMGFGLGVAVLIDATIVRSVLVPASMRLLGAWNWYLPTWLEWLPKVHIEGARTPETPADIDVTGPTPAPMAPAVPNGRVRARAFRRRQRV